MAEGWIQNYLGGIVEVDEKDTWTVITHSHFLGRRFCGFRPGCRGLSGRGLRP